LPRSIGQAGFLERAHKAHGNRYDYSKAVYSGAQKKLIIICRIHGEFSQTPNNHYCTDCPKCALETSHRAKALTQEEFLLRAKEIHGDLFDYSLTVYAFSQNRRVKIICSKHGIFEQSPKAHLQQKQGCPKCAASKGEKAIENFLISKNIPFETQKTFEKCKDKRKLRFDFWLPNFNTLIEFDGKQHFKPVEFSNCRIRSKHHFEDTIRKDEIKSRFCLESKIKLIRIAYFEDPTNKLLLELLGGT
jgi:hypothetical protein